MNCRQQVGAVSENLWLKSEADWCLVNVGVLTDVSLEEFDKQIHNLAVSHFIFAKAVLPLLKMSDTSSYTIVTGGAGAI